MLSKTRSAAVHSRAPDTFADPAGDGAPAVREPSVAATEQPDRTATGEETRGGRFRRHALRTRLHGYAIVFVALIAYLIALAVSNTAHVKVSWVFGGSHVSLVWLVLFAAILGWVLGLATGARFRWRTRAPQRRSDATS